MRRLLLLVAVVTMLSMAVGRASSLGEFSSATLSVISTAVEPTTSDGEEELPATEVPWAGHGAEHQVVECTGVATWQLVLTGLPSGTEALLVATFETAGELAPVAGEPRGGDRIAATGFRVTTPVGDRLAAATAHVSGELARSPRLSISDSTCETITRPEATESGESEGDSETPVTGSDSAVAEPAPTAAAPDELDNASLQEH